MKTIVAPVSLAVLVVALPLARLSGQRSAETPHAAEIGFYAPETIEWKAGPPSLPAGSKMAALEGDPTKEGPFVMRLQMPEGYHIPPHTHPKTEHVTVISGAFYLAMGEKLNRGDAKQVPTGSFAFWPAGMKHAAWAEGETVIQLHGIGPWQINYLNPADDPRNAKKSP
jgi:quercetin dioxygenase-like cupin family protein